MKSSSIFWEQGCDGIGNQFSDFVYVMVPNSELCFLSNVTFSFWFSEGTGNLIRPLIHVASGHFLFNPDSSEVLDLANCVIFQAYKPHG
jgi:hypothetical protein